MSDKNYRIAYSSESGGRCTECGKFLHKCKCSAKQETAPAADTTVLLRREKKGRKGKTVITISELPLLKPGLKEVCKILKQRCACGGTVKGKLIEIQSEDKELIGSILIEQGYKIKWVGG